MIPKIIKGYNTNSIYGVLHYHETKVKEGAAEKTDQTVLASDLQTIHQAFVEHMETHNPKVYKHQFHQLVLSFDPEDKVDHLTKREILHEYMESMGYDDHLYVAYHHMDKDHDHWHVILTASDLDGKLKSTRNDFHQSARIARQLEKKYDLRVLNKSSTHQQQKKEFIDLENHRFQNAYRNFVADHGDDEIQYPELLNDKVTNNQFRYFFKSQGREDEYRFLITNLYKEQYLEKTKIQQIKETLLETRKRSRSLEEFLLNLNETPNFYGRFVKQDGSITYGYKDLYITDKKLDKQFTPDALRKYYDPNKKISHDFKSVKRFVGNRIKIQLAKSNSWEEFKDLLQTDNIHLDIKHRSNGTSLTFQHLDYNLKSSALGYSYPKIDELFNRRSKLIPSNISKGSSTKKKSASSKIARSATFAGKQIAAKNAAEANYERELSEQNSISDFDL